MSNFDNKEQNKTTNTEKTITKHQQQILFSDTELFPDKQSLTDTTQQIIFDNQDLVPFEEEIEESNEVLMQDIKLTSKPRWLWRIVLSLISVMVCVETFNFFIAGFTESPISTSIYGIILAGLTFIAGGALWRELSGLRQLKHQQHIKAQAVETLADETPINVEQFCQQLSKNLPSDLMSSQEDKWLEALKGEYSDSELLQLYSKLVLSHVDKKVIAEISKFSTEAVVLVALSPVALIDMLVMLWRNLRMLDKISGLYGLKLGYWSRIKLIKQVFINMAYAGASELIADFGTEMVGADLLGKMSARLAQGLGAGLLTSRLGLKAMHLCRPLPFNDNPPKLTEVRKEILNQLKSLVKK
ncbi:MAG: YcjF family protein [Colwellia sp.]|nr:YcjF family protein [Colwellia sp.]